MANTLRTKTIQRVIVEETKTVRTLLADLGLSENHVVLIGGKQASLDTVVPEKQRVIVLPLIAGGS